MRNSPGIRRTLAAHLAEMPGWTVPTVKQDSLDFAPRDTFQPTKTSFRQEILELFDESIAARKAILSASDDVLMKALLSISLQEECGVGATKSEGVGKDVVQLCFAGGVRGVV